MTAFANDSRRKKESVAGVTHSTTPPYHDDAPVCIKEVPGDTKDGLEKHDFYSPLSESDRGGFKLKFGSAFGCPFGCSGFVL